jgi:hypothetical protein
MKLIFQTKKINISDGNETTTYGIAINHTITTLNSKRGSFQRVVSTAGVFNQTVISQCGERGVVDSEVIREFRSIYGTTLCAVKNHARRVCTLSHLAQLNPLFCRLTRVSRALTIDTTRQDSC